MMESRSSVKVKGKADHMDRLLGWVILLDVE